MVELTMLHWLLPPLCRLQYCPGSATRCSNLHQLQRDIRQCVHGQLRQLLCWLNTGYMHNKQRLDLQWSLRT